MEKGEGNEKDLRGRKRTTGDVTEMRRGREGMRGDGERMREDGEGM